MREHMEQGMTEEEMNRHAEEERGSQMMDDYEEMADDYVAEGFEALYREEGDVKDGLVVNLNISPVPYNVGVSLSVDFFVNTKPGNVPVPTNQLQIEHTKLMHVVGLRSDMNEFFHIHPEFLADDPSIFNIKRTFQKPGFYKIWSSVKKDDVIHTFGHPEVSINGAGTREDKKVSFSRNVITENYQVSMATDDTVIKEREVELSFDIHTLTGREVEVEPYLDADMHLTIIKDDWSQFLHTHPEGTGHSHSQAPRLPNPSALIRTSIAFAHGDAEDESAGATDEHQTTASDDEVISFHVTFPEIGLYKTFAQFRPQGIDLPSDEAITAEFWIQVEEKAPFPISQWWFLLAISAILIAGLSWVVNKYLKVKPEDVQIQK